MALRQFEEELNNLNSALQEMGALVAQSIHRSVRSLLEKNEDYAHEVLRDEARIDDARSARLAWSAGATPRGG